MKRGNFATLRAKFAAVKGTFRDREGDAEPMTAIVPQRRSFPSLGRAAAFAATLALLLSMVGSVRAEPTYSFDTTPGRLPKTVVPAVYAIDLVPDLQGLTLAGSEVVDIDVRQATPKITLNAVKMTFGDVSIDAEPRRAEVNLDPASETATLSFAQPIAPGPHRLRRCWLRCRRPRRGCRCPAGRPRPARP